MQHASAGSQRRSSRRIRPLNVLVVGVGAALPAIDQKGVTIMEGGRKGVGVVSVLKCLEEVF